VTVGPEHEEPRAGPGDFEDSVLVEVSDAEHEIFGFIRLARLPNAPAASMLAILFAGEELVVRQAETLAGLDIASWDRAEAAGVRLETAEPLRRWAAAFTGDEATFELEATATSEPIDLTEPASAAVARGAGVSRYEQFCEIRGEVKVNGNRRELAGVGRRVHEWGAPGPAPGSLVRSLYAVSSDQGLAVQSVRLDATESHGDELVAAYLAERDSPPARFEDVHLSTIYDSEGVIRKAGLELYMPGDEYPRRTSGVARRATILEAAGTRRAISFFEWSVGGAPGQGSYQMISRA
jgi:hypothetical protein